MTDKFNPEYFMYTSSMGGIETVKVTVGGSTNKDAVNPDHYKVGGIETWDYLRAKLSPTQLAGFALGNCLKYISRADHKNKLEDLRKSKWYLDKIIEELEK